MKKTFLSIVLVWAFVICALVSSAAAQNVLLSEVEVNPPVDSTTCQYVELRGKPTAALGNLYFISVDGDASAAPGTVDVAVNLSGRSFAWRGLLVITGVQDCAGRTFPEGTTVVIDTQLTGSLGFGSQSFLLVATTASISPGDDLDTDDDGTFDALPAGATVVDGFGWTDGFDGDSVYGARLETIASAPLGEAPDAATRFISNSTPLSSGAWYYGDLQGADNNSIAYSTAVKSVNFPSFGRLTPGDFNLPYPVVPFLQCVAPSGTGFTARFGYVNPNPGSVTIPVGTKNRFFPAPANRGQTTVFQSGIVATAFSVPFPSGSSLTWTLTGPDNLTSTASASSNSRRCQ